MSEGKSMGDYQKDHTLNLLVCEYIAGQSTNTR